MQKFAILTSVIALFATSAVAGGYTSTVVEVEPVATEQAVYNWTGAYVGASVAKTGAKLSFENLDDFGDSFEAKIDEDANTYGIFAGYRHQYQNGLVAGVEASYAKTENFGEIDGTEIWNVEAQAGVAFDRVLPYVAVGYGKYASEEAVTVSVGADWALSDKLIVGAKYTRADIGDVTRDKRDFNVDVDTISLRASYRF